MFDLFGCLSLCWTLQKKKNKKTSLKLSESVSRMQWNCSLYDQLKRRKSRKGHFQHTFVMRLSNPPTSSKRILSAGSFILEGIRALVLCSCRGSGNSGGLGFLPVSLCPCGVSVRWYWWSSPPPLSHSCIFLCTAVTHRQQNSSPKLHGRCVFTVMCNF